MSQEINEEQLQNLLLNVFDVLLSSEKERRNVSYRNVINQIKDQFPLDSAEKFNILFMFELDQILDMAIKNALPDVSEKNKNNLIFLYKNYEFIENQLEWLIKQREGIACVNDKTRWLLHHYAKFQLDGAALDMTISEKCFWKPKFGTGEHWLSFIDGIQAMYYGKNNVFFEKITSLLQNNFF